MKAWQHFKTINHHKMLVMKGCFRVGLYKQGLLHDLSKYTPTEFLVGCRYFQGNLSPNNIERKEKGYSLAWLHHKGRNKHHYEYWQDNFDNGGIPIEMPLRYKKEMLCDYLGAGRAYYGKDFTYIKEYTWWQNKMNKPLAMHPSDKKFITIWLSELVNEGDCIFRKLREVEK